MSYPNRDLIEHVRRLQAQLSLLALGLQEETKFSAEAQLDLGHQLVELAEVLRKRAEHEGDVIEGDVIDDRPTQRRALPAGRQARDYFSGSVER